MHAVQSLKQCKVGDRKAFLAFGGLALGVLGNVWVTSGSRKVFKPNSGNFHKTVHNLGFDFLGLLTWLVLLTGPEKNLSKFILLSVLPIHISLTSSPASQNKQIYNKSKIK